MTAIVAGMFFLAVAMVIQRVAVWRQERRAIAREQAFRFHALRDELQEMAVRGDVVSNDRSYLVLMSILNLCIRNAGAFRLRDLVQLARRVDDRVESTTVSSSLRSAPESVQDLTERTIHTVGQMLVQNDKLVALGVRCYVFWHRRIAAPLQSLLRSVAPDYAFTVRTARRYQSFAL